MADLMTGKVNYKKLADQYANFIVPTVKIKVNGTDVVKMNNLVVYELEMNLSVSTASSVKIKFAHQYDVQSHSFSGDVKDSFELGTIVTVELGYLSTTQELFKGYVEMAGVEMGEQELFVVTLMDAKRLMMISGKKNKLYTVKNYSDAFNEVMGDYSSLCSLEVEATNDQLEDPISQMSNDYDFVMTELIRKGRVNREFVILAGKAYFREPHKVTTPIMTLQYGRELVNLSVSHCYKDLKIEVIGMDSQQQAVKGEAEVKSTASQSNIITNTPVFRVGDPHADTADKAKTIAEAIARQESEKCCIGQGKTIGIPEIVPGRYIEVENIDSMIDKQYYITDVVHLYTRESYTTQFEIGGCAS